MSNFVDEQSTSQDHFEDSIFPVTLQFKDADIEARYNVKKAQALALSKQFKWGGLVFFAVVVFRRIELLVFAIANIESITTNVNVEYLQTSLLAATIFVEVLMATIPVLKKLKGYCAMVYIFFMVCHTSFYYLPSKPSSVPVYELSFHHFLEESLCISAQ